MVHGSEVPKRRYPLAAEQSCRTPDWAADFQCVCWNLHVPYQREYNGIMWKRFCVSCASLKGSMRTAVSSPKVARLRDLKLGLALSSHVDPKERGLLSNERAMVYDLTQSSHGQLSRVHSIMMAVEKREQLGLHVDVQSYTRRITLSCFFDLTKIRLFKHRNRCKKG